MENVAEITVDDNALYEFLQKNQSKDQFKVQFGYTIDSYKGVFAELEKYNQMMTEIYRGSVFGQEYTKTGLVFDSNNFSQQQACLWKMQLKLFGAMGVRCITSGNDYEIVATQGFTQEVMAQCGCPNQCPPLANLETIRGLQKLQVGAFISSANLEKYLKHFYVNNNTDISKKWDVPSLIANKLLRCQIISPKHNGNGSTCTIIGDTRVSEDSRLLVNPALFSTSNFSSSNINIYLKELQGDSTQMVIPSDGSYQFCVGGNKTVYNEKTATINGYTPKSLSDALSGSTTLDVKTTDSIMQLADGDYWVKIYISDKAEAEKKGYVPTGLRDSAYSPLVDNLWGSGEIVADFNPDVQEMMRCINELCQQQGMLLFTPETIKKNTGFNGKKCTSALGLSTKKSGFFTIPSGYPMYVDTRYDAIKSGSNRNDLDLQTKSKNFKSTKFWDGKMDEQWYRKRLKIADTGTIEVYCQSKGEVSKKFNDLFNNIYGFYQRAASKYNKNKPKQAQINAGLMLLKCAPSLCCISSIHRNRPGHELNRHQNGQAMDFDVPGNKATGSFEEHLKMQITRGMQIPYRPFLHYLYKLGGVWGGAYRFMKGYEKSDKKSGKKPDVIRKFDAMHIEF